MSFEGAFRSFQSFGGFGFISIDTDLSIVAGQQIKAACHQRPLRVNSGQRSDLLGVMFDELNHEFITVELGHFPYQIFASIKCFFRG